MVWVEILLQLISLIFCTKNQTILKIFFLSDSHINPQKTSYSKTESCCMHQAKHLCSSPHTYLLRTHEINKKSSKFSNHFGQNTVTITTLASLLKATSSKFSHKELVIFMLLTLICPLRNFSLQRDYC